MFNNPDQSNYFDSAIAIHGKYQWNIKYNGWHDDYEIEEAIRWAFGKDFDRVRKLLSKQIECSLEGRSRGWLVINSDLTDTDLEIVSDFISKAINDLPNFLEEFRKQTKRRHLTLIYGGKKR